MRSFTPKTLRTATLAALLVTVPFAGADAGPHEAALINQIESVDTGIRGAMQANSIKLDEARGLRTQVAQLDRAAQRAARDGTMPATQYHKMLAQIDHVSQRLRAATGSAFLIGSGGDGGYYPNGYGPNYPKG
ncbi:hypothetical protein [Mesorhizobium sp.]|uniref:hypothetical protein n=1 Tax=Mesorhizobium sp. TaxID=1871066 RepID=UPI000FE9F2D1|nr:hypothetical protein [Mesorhizobium sp.]RWP59314.1 MAG: hypothetical protein EOR08_24410 [Mesorhizobium sp.]